MEPDTEFWEIEDELDGYFSRQVIIPSDKERVPPRYEMFNYCLPTEDELYPEEKRNDKDVLRNYEVPSSLIASANGDTVTDFFRWRNYVQIRDAGQKLDEVKHELDNGRNMSREEAGLIVRNAYEEFKNVYDRVDEFEHDNLKLIYSEEDLKPFLEYIERLEGHAVNLAWDIEKLDRAPNLEKSKEHLDTYQQLENTENTETQQIRIEYLTQQESKATAD